MKHGAALFAGLMGLGSLSAFAQTVLAGRMGDRALLMIDGQRHIVAVGQSVGGVTLLRWQGDQAMLQAEGVTWLLRLGAHPARLTEGPAPTPPGREIVISAGPGGHFIAHGSINGQAVQFMVDTGATLVALSKGEARRLALDLRNARQVTTQTANGPVPSQLVQLSRVRVGSVELRHVDAVLLPAQMPHVLLGNSFLGRFQMRRENDIMRLELR
jgi:aspartyl protease family protein